MSMLTPEPASPLLPHALQNLRRSWGWFLVLGIALIILGAFAVSFAFIATLGTVLAFGIMLLVGGVFQLGTAIFARGWRGFLLHLIAGSLYVIAGLLMVENPLRAAEVITFMMALFFMAGGLFRIVGALAEQFHGWGWVFLNGIITLALGVLIWRQIPWSGLWVIGLFVGIDLLFSGWSAVMVALALRGLPKTAA